MLLSEHLEHFFSNRSIGMISAARPDLSTEENDARHEALRNDLTRRGHLVHDAEGVWEGNKEKSFLVAHHQSGSDKGLIAHSLVDLGKKYGQSSVLIKPHYTERAYLHGTNETGYPGMDKQQDIGTFHRGDQDGNYSKVRGQTFHFAESVEPKKLRMIVEADTRSQYEKIKALHDHPNTEPSLKARAAEWMSKNAPAAKRDPWSHVKDKNFRSAEDARNMHDRTQGWAPKTPMFDEDGEVSVYHMENHTGILKHHGFTHAGVDREGNHHWEHPRKGTVIMKKNMWVHKHPVVDDNVPRARSYGMMADTLHDSLKKESD